MKWKLNVKIKNTIDDYQLKTSMLRLNAGLLTTGTNKRNSSFENFQTDLIGRMNEYTKCEV